MLWGTTGTARALGPDEASVLGIGALRLLIGGAGLVVVAGLVRRRRPAAAPGWRRGLLLPWALATAGVAAYQPSFFAAVREAGVALGTAVAIGSAPVLAGLLEWTVLRRPPRAGWWLATAVGVLGLVLLAGPGSADPLGVVLALGAGLSYAVFAVASRVILVAGVPSLEAMAASFGAGGLLLTPLLVTQDFGWLAGLDGWLMILWLALVTTTPAYMLFGAGLARLDASTAATLSLAEPVTAAVLALTVLGERPTVASAGGALLILLGLALLARDPGS